MEVSYFLILESKKRRMMRSSSIPTAPSSSRIPDEASVPRHGPNEQESPPFHRKMKKKRRDSIRSLSPIHEAEDLQKKVVVTDEDADVMPSDENSDY